MKCIEDSQSRIQWLAIVVIDLMLKQRKKTAAWSEIICRRPSSVGTNEI